MANESKDEMKITTEQFLNLRSDVRDVLNAVKGSENLGHEGLASRVSVNENEIQKAIRERNRIESEIDNLKTKIIAYTAGAGAAAGAAAVVMQLIVSYLP